MDVSTVNFKQGIRRAFPGPTIRVFQCQRIKGLLRHFEIGLFLYFARREFDSFFISFGEGSYTSKFNSTLSVYIFPTRGRLVRAILFSWVSNRVYRDCTPFYSRPGILYLNVVDLRSSKIFYGSNAERFREYVPPDYQS